MFILKAETGNQVKLDHYIDLMLNQEKLVKSSRNIIKKKHSPLARQIANGNVKAILQAAKDRIFGSLNREERLRLCKILCDLKNKVRRCTQDCWREFIVLAIAGTIALISPISGLLIELLWVIRQKIQSAICSCNLSGICKSGACY